LFEQLNRWKCRRKKKKTNVKPMTYGFVEKMWCCDEKKKKSGIVFCRTFQFDDDWKWLVGQWDKLCESPKNCLKSSMTSYTAEK
jgi:hypothetical protein